MNALRVNGLGVMMIQEGGDAELLYFFPVCDIYLDRQRCVHHQMHGGDARLFVKETGYDPPDVTGRKGEYKRSSKCNWHRSNMENHPAGPLPRPAVRA